MAYKGVGCNLVNFLTGPMGQSMAMAVENVNTWLGAANLMPLTGAFVGDSLLGRYWTILVSSLLYILDLSFDGFLHMVINSYSAFFLVSGLIIIKYSLNVNLSILPCTLELVSDMEITPSLETKSV
ncbi:hypothetical protein FEM48_ZijujUnG0040600 [Ziziphus jujuba var. spinosa]|uniref:Uncharacterized protein n=1 Tax=Ziziphus jujuba var. spinosa TaxID=714518 RepID=A0A978U9B4_ZIZJJ|nr:hypothetical protein FEM48_ZijujUnG0040600 [Ziziphus jujuba var. spinosa]